MLPNPNENKTMNGLMSRHSSGWVLSLVLVASRWGNIGCRMSLALVESTDTAHVKRSSDRTNIARVPSIAALVIRCMARQERQADDPLAEAELYMVWHDNTKAVVMPKAELRPGRARPMTLDKWKGNHGARFCRKEFVYHVYWLLFSSSN